MIDFCKSEADAYFAAVGVPVNVVDGSGAPPADPENYGGLDGGAFYDRTQNTVFTPANIFWARFNRVRQGGASALQTTCP
jgi:hypothetical protein